MEENNKHEVLSDEEQRKRRKELALQRVAANKKKGKRNRIIASVSCTLIIIAFIVYYTVVIPKNHFDRGIILRDSGKWDEAVAEFEQAGIFAHGGEEVKKVRYLEGKTKREAKDWDGAADAFHAAEDYLDAATQELAMYYAYGEEKRGQQKWEDAICYFERAKSYHDAATQITETLYQKANWFLSHGEYEEAYEVFTSITGYRDAHEVLKSNSALSAIHEKRHGDFATIGTEVVFGRIEQDEELSNGEEPITWIVLFCDGNKSLLLSKYALGAERHYNKNTRISWEDSLIKSWLESMKARSFTENEKSAIIGELALLSHNEFNTYLPNQETRICRTLKEVIEKGDEARTTAWWLKTSVFEQTSVTVTQRSHGYVHHEKTKSLVTGVVGTDGVYFGTSLTDKRSIRPIMWVDLQKLDDII